MSDGFDGTTTTEKEMPLFRCDKCGVVDNTALGTYWARKSRGEPPLCNECEPDIGKWHDEFLKRSAEGMLIDQNGHLWSRDEVDAGRLPKHYRIVGEVPSNAEPSRPREAD